VYASLQGKNEEGKNLMSSTQAAVEEASQVKKDVVKAVDPLKPWYELRDVYMKSWAKVMGEAVNTEDYAKANGVVLDSYLTVAAPFKEAQQKAMLSALEQLNMPSRADFVSLAERLANMELLLDDVYAKLSQIHQIATSAASRPAPEAKPPTISETKVATTSPEPANLYLSQSAPKANVEAKSSERKMPAKTTKNQAR
jgi:hypothetical protein